MSSLRLLGILGRVLPAELHTLLEQQLPHVAEGLKHPSAAVRLAAADCATALSSCRSAALLPALLEYAVLATGACLARSLLARPLRWASICMQLL